jgi:hypothetical protein
MENTNLKCWGQVFPISSFGMADGVIKIHIQDGIAPFRMDLKVNGNFYRAIENIPPAEFNYETFEPPENVNYADTNCVITDLPPGAYSGSIYDSTPESEGGPQEVRIIADWNAVSPPFATLNGSVNPLGQNAVVAFEYGNETQCPSGTGNYCFEAAYGIVNGNEPVICSLQLSSGGYSSTTNLLPNTLYHYRIKAIIDGVSTYGDDMTFTTPQAGPIVVTLPATDIHN